MSEEKPASSAGDCTCEKWPDDHVHCHHKGAPCCHCACNGRPEWGVVGRFPRSNYRIVEDGDFYLVYSKHADGTFS